MITINFTDDDTEKMFLADGSDEVLEREFAGLCHFMHVKCERRGKLKRYEKMTHSWEVGNKYFEEAVRDITIGGLNGVAHLGDMLKKKAGNSQEDQDNYQSFRESLAKALNELKEGMEE